MPCILCFGEGLLHHGPCMTLNMRDYNKCKRDPEFFEERFAIFLKENTSVESSEVLVPRASRRGPSSA